MLSRARRTITFGSLMAATLLGTTVTGQETKGTRKRSDLQVTPDTFEALWKAIRPKPGDKASVYLDEMEWQPTVGAAQRKALAQGKPIYIFATVSPPLGTS